MLDDGPRSPYRKEAQECVGRRRLVSASPQNGKAVHALELRWAEPNDPLPLKALRGIRRATAAPGYLDSPPWIGTGPADQPFHFCQHVRLLLEDIVARTPEFQHIQVARILVGAMQARNGRAHGLQARVTPLRFPQGKLQRKRRDVIYQVQRYFLGEH